MELLMNSVFINEIDKFIDTIKDSDEYKKYMDLTNKLDNCDDIKNITKEIKDINKELVKIESIELINKLKYKELELNSIPLYQDYLESVKELNYILSLIKDKIDNYIENL